MRKILLVLDSFIDDKIIISNEKIYTICKTYYDFKSELENPKSYVIYTYNLFSINIKKCKEQGLDLYVLFCDGSEERIESSSITGSVLNSYIKKNDEIRKDVLTSSVESYDRNNLKYICKLNTILKSSYELTDSIKDNYTKLTPSNEYELVKLVISKNPAIGNIIVLEDKKTGSIIRNGKELDNIRKELIRSKITDKDSEYIYHTSNGFIVSKENKTFVIKSKQYGNTYYIF